MEFSDPFKPARSHRDKECGPQTVKNVEVQQIMIFTYPMHKFYAR